jgi:AAA+ ATPase superfamily predicted ATPase
VPLRPGENEIVLTAYDVDSPPHWTSERFSVFRDPPLYRTAAFGVSLGALVLLGIGGWLISLFMKYRIAIVNKYNPYIAGSPIRQTEMLFGREALLRTILNTIQNNSIMLYGPRRIGKTSLQYELKRRLEDLKDPEYRYIPAMIDLQGTSEEHFFATVMGDILDACKPVVGDKVVSELRERKDPREPYSVRDFSKDLKSLLDVAQVKSERKVKLVLLLDEVDELNKYSEQTNQKLRSVFMKTFAEKMVAVMSGVHIKKNWQSEGSPWYNFFEEIEIPPLVRDDAVRLIRKPVHGIFTYEEAAVDKILEYSECKPYLVQRLCVNAVNQAIDAKRRRITVGDVETAQALIVKFVEAAA